MLTDSTKQDALRRLSRIAGQVQGLSRMVEEKRYCIDIIIQIAAVEAALHRLAERVLRNHLETCVVGAFESHSAQERKEKIEELVRVFRALRPK